MMLLQLITDRGCMTFLPKINQRALPLISKYSSNIYHQIRNTSKGNDCLITIVLTTIH